MSDYEKYFNSMVERDKNFPKLPLLKKPCHDCAVVCGFYEEMSRGLSVLDEKTREIVSRKWFCHNNSKFACKGNADIVGIK